MFTSKQLAQWRLLLARFVCHDTFSSLPHSFDDDIATILRYCLAINTKFSTFLTAAEFWRRIATQCRRRKYDIETMLACIVGLAAELHEIDLIGAEDLRECALHFHADSPEAPNVCQLDESAYRQCLCFLLQKLQGECYTSSLCVDFLHCVFCNAPACFQDLTTTDIDSEDATKTHCHENEQVALSTCKFEHVKLWCEFATLFGYTRSDYVVLFVSQLVANKCDAGDDVSANQARCCSGCLSKLVPGFADGNDYCRQLIGYGHCMLVHLVSVFDETLSLRRRYTLPTEWRNLDTLLCKTCPKCQFVVDQTIPSAAETISIPPSVGIIFERNNCQVTPEQRLDAGTYGEVYSVFDRQSNKIACIKLFADTGFIREIGIALRLNHQNILPLLRCGYNTHYDQVWSMTQFFECGNLQRLLKAERLTKAASHSIMLGLAQALYYMHRNSLLHFDVKPGNVLCSRDGTIVKLFDFSISHRAQNNFTPKQHGYCASMIASMSYRAPELLKHDGGAIFVFAADVWSLGAIFYRLLERSHKPLVCDEEKTTDGALQQIFNLQACNLTTSMLKHYALPERLEKNQARWDQIVQDTSVNAADLLDSLLNLRPELRITMKTALRHPYLCQHIVL